MGGDHYELLGVPRFASIHEVRRAWLGLFKQVTAAYEVLCDDALRAAYDATLRAAARAAPRASADAAGGDGHLAEKGGRHQQLEEDGGRPRRQPPRTGTGSPSVVAAPGGHWQPSGAVGRRLST
eukprot:gene49425-62090_t